MAHKASNMITGMVLSACLGLLGHTVTLAQTSPTASSVLPRAAVLVGAHGPHACILPPQPPKPLDALNVQDFGAVPDDGNDDTVAIREALRALRPGQWLVFPSGTYQHHSRLIVDRVGVVLLSEGATLHATNPVDQAVLLAADGASIYNFTLTAVTDVRRHAPWESRIAVFDRVEREAPLQGNVIAGNRIVNAGAPGSPTANASSSAAILVYRAKDFLIANNEVRRSLSDGIHITEGSSNGRVIGNVVRETGDDMIALVSYFNRSGWVIDRTKGIAHDLTAQRKRQVVSNVLIAFNEVSGQYWGRGISVVGGEDITIRDNRISKTTTAAGVLVAREASYVTWGVRNVLIERNHISQVQTTSPSYTPVGWKKSGVRTGHAGIEIHAFVFDQERLDPLVLEQLSVDGVRAAHNTIDDVMGHGVRVGEGTGVHRVMSSTRREGHPMDRRFSGGSVVRIDLTSNAMSRTPAGALLVKSASPLSSGIRCEALTSDGSPVVNAACFGPRPVITGATQTCSH